jgi:hypothetical protein
MRPLACQESGDDHRGLDSAEENESPGPRTQTAVGKGKSDRVQKELKTREPAAGGEGMIAAQNKRQQRKGKRAGGQPDSSEAGGIDRVRPEGHAAENGIGGECGHGDHGQKPGPQMSVTLMQGRFG